MRAAELFDLSGEVALVTGASSGLGRRFARTLAANGAAVIVLARRLDRLEGLVAEVEAAGGRALAAEADVTDAAAVARAFDLGEARFGPVGVVVNNAGIAPAAKVLDMTAEHWREVMATNLDAVVTTAQEGARRMVASGHGGSIVNVASILGLGVQRGVAAYATAKAGVIQATKALALELGPRGVRVNALAPGYVATDLNRDWLASPAGERMRREVPLGRFGEEGDLDGALLLLASPAGRFITGATLVADGGHVVGLRG